jgi:hypothetical protein
MISRSPLLDKYRIVLMSATQIENLIRSINSDPNHRNSIHDFYATVVERLKNAWAIAMLS